jgi:hypothetical protein
MEAFVSLDRSKHTKKKDGGRKNEDRGKEFGKERWQRLTLGESIYSLSLPS